MVIVCLRFCGVADPCRAPTAPLNRHAKGTGHPVSLRNGTILSSLRGAGEPDGAVLGLPGRVVEALVRQRAMGLRALRDGRAVHRLGEKWTMDNGQWTENLKLLICMDLACPFAGLAHSSISTRPSSPSRPGGRCPNRSRTQTKHRTIASIRLTPPATPESSNSRHTPHPTTIFVALCYLPSLAALPPLTYVAIQQPAHSHPATPRSQFQWT